MIRFLNSTFAAIQPPSPTYPIPLSQTITFPSPTYPIPFPNYHISQLTKSLLPSPTYPIPSPS